MPSAEARGEILRVLLRAVPHALRPAELAEVSLPAFTEPFSGRS